LCASAGRVNTKNISIYIYGKETKDSKEEEGDEKEAPLAPLLSNVRENTSLLMGDVFFYPVISRTPRGLPRR